MVNNYSIAEKINTDVNSSLKYCSDKEHYNKPEMWTIPTDGKGDCEDFALAKRARLIEMGWPADDIFLCTCFLPSGQGHVVLYVVTNKGGYILDNIEQYPRKPEALGYIWEKIQVGDKWHVLEGWE